jgi:hypothetical protein
LQKLFRVVQELIGLLGIHSEGPRGELRRHSGLRDGRIGGNETNFVHMNVRIALERGLQLLGELHGLRSGAGWKAAHEAREACVGQFG